MHHTFDDIDMKGTGRDRGPVAMGAIRIGSRDTFTAPGGGTVDGPAVVYYWRFASGRLVGQVERPGGVFENVPGGAA